MLTELFALFLTLLAYGFWLQRRPKGFPSGPQGLPLLGYAPFLGTQPHVAFGELSKVYGKIYSVFLGNLPVVVLNDIQDIKDAFKQDVFSGRPKDKLLGMEVVPNGIVFNEGPSWMEHRRFSVKVLRDLGFGKQSMQETIGQEIQDLVEFLKSLKDQPFDPKHTLQVSLINCLWMMIASEKFSLDDPRALHLRKIVYEGFIEPEQSGAVFFLPWLARTFPKWTGFDKTQLVVAEMDKMLRKTFAEHEATMTDGFARDYIDMVLKKISETTDPTSSFYKEEGKKQVIDSLMTFFTAGADTLASTLCYLMMYLISNPEISRKCQEEIDRVVGNRDPQIEDRPQMPYLEATLSEVMRISSIVSGAIMHCTTAPVEFKGYKLPKRTIVMSNLFGVHHNEQLWPEPNVFKPERFLDSDGNFQKNPNWIPFGFGKRYCPADYVGMMELFLYASNLVQKFEFVQHPDHPLPPLDVAKTGLVLTPQPFSLVFKERK